MAITARKTVWVQVCGFLVATACTVEITEGAPFTGGAGSGASAAETGDSGDGSDTGEDGAEDEAGSDSGADEGETGPGETSAADESGDEGASFIDPDDTGGGDASYAPCPDGMCPGGESCLSAGPPNHNKTYCAANCAGPGDPSSCPVPSTGDAPPSCIVVGDQMGQNIQDFCALDCSGGQTCPDGKTCLADQDMNGPVSICV